MCKDSVKSVDIYIYMYRLEGYGKHAFRSTVYNEGTQLYFK